MKFLMATDKNDLELYQACITSMYPLYLAFGTSTMEDIYPSTQHFFKTFYETHPGAKGLLEKGALSVARSLLPGCRNPVDLTIAQTFLKHTKY